MNNNKVEYIELLRANDLIDGVYKVHDVAMGSAKKPRTSAITKTKHCT